MFNPIGRGFFTSEKLGSFRRPRLPLLCENGDGRILKRGIPGPSIINPQNREDNKEMAGAA